MFEDQAPVEIKILVDEEVPYVAETAKPDVASEAQQTVKAIAAKSVAVAESAWRSDARERVSRSIIRGSAAVAAKSNRFLRERVARQAEGQIRKQASAVRDRVQSTDWKREAKTTTANSLRWLSHRLAKLAERFTPAKESPPERQAETQRRS